MKAPRTVFVKLVTAATLLSFIVTSPGAIAFHLRGAGAGHGGPEDPGKDSSSGRLHVNVVAGEDTEPNRADRIARKVASASTASNLNTTTNNDTAAAELPASSSYAIMKERYPDCPFSIVDASRLGDGSCDSFFSENSEECGWDGGDCIEINEKYPKCQALFLSGLGDGFCDDFGGTNTEACGWDGGDCVVEGYENCHIHVLEHYWLGNGQCHGGRYNTEGCGWDGGDCVEFNKKYPDCYRGSVPEFDALRDTYPDRVGDGTCDGGESNTEACGWDGGDCIEFNEKYPGCNVTKPSYIGDGQCDGGDYNTEACGWDGGDCIEFNEKYPGCNVDYVHSIGDGTCRGGDYNTEECDWDGGDCIKFNEKYPGCNVDYVSGIGDGDCEGGEYNTEACGWDGGDCV